MVVITAMIQIELFYSNGIIRLECQDCEVVSVKCVSVLPSSKSLGLPRRVDKIVELARTQIHAGK